MEQYWGDFWEGKWWKRPQGGIADDGDWPKRGHARAQGPLEMVWGSSCSVALLLWRHFPFGRLEMVRPSNPGATDIGTNGSI
ncbi:uncharacterized protein CCOS01_15966 [Colletotrichum costaricense]|uniref:Uncharacterized protein n=1 Tax=Colletotrichum costaricense TaxID=1209916 RepID=A0AAI9YGT7_9PEZI|nr:uncharacterized protein CCOS01_15966 [Colletotrichum costaricense]KAK1508305.1 hypothetical protein CCOS01_15966 [Colletotrichum costaricense]